MIGCEYVAPLYIAVGCRCRRNCRRCCHAWYCHVGRSRWGSSSSPKNASSMAVQRDRRWWRPNRRHRGARITRHGARVGRWGILGSGVAVASGAPPCALAGDQGAAAAGECSACGGSVATDADHPPREHAKMMAAHRRRRVRAPRPPTYAAARRRRFAPRRVHHASPAERGARGRHAAHQGPSNRAWARAQTTIRPVRAASSRTAASTSPTIPLLPPRPPGGVHHRGRRRSTRHHSRRRRRKSWRAPGTGCAAAPPPRAVRRTGTSKAYAGRRGRSHRARRATQPPPRRRYARPWERTASLDDAAAQCGALVA